MLDFLKRDKRGEEKKGDSLVFQAPSADELSRLWSEDGAELRRKTEEEYAASFQISKRELTLLLD